MAMEDQDDSVDPARLSDDALLEAYEATGGTPEARKADRLITEIQRHGLDV